jgi:hypothetical protein
MLKKVWAIAALIATTGIGQGWSQSLIPAVAPEVS